MNYIVDFVNYVAPVQHGNDKQGMLMAAKLIGLVGTVACAVFFAMGTLPVTTAAVLGSASFLVLLGGMTDRPHLVYLGLVIAGLWLTSFINLEIFSIYDLPPVITL